MKYKIHYKSLDQVDDRKTLVQKINEFLYFFYSEKNNFTGMHIDEDGSEAITFSIQFNWKIQDTFHVSIIWPKKEGDPYLISKTKYGEYESFTKEELKFFDALDFEMGHGHNMVTGQDIHDWVTM